MGVDSVRERTQALVEASGQVCGQQRVGEALSWQSEGRTPAEPQLACSLSW